MGALITNTWTGPSSNVSKIKGVREWQSSSLISRVRLNHADSPKRVAYKTIRERNSKVVIAIKGGNKTKCNRRLISQRRRNAVWNVYGLCIS